MGSMIHNLHKLPERSQAVTMLDAAAVLPLQIQGAQENDQEVQARSICSRFANLIYSAQLTCARWQARLHSAKRWCVLVVQE
jgi:hypothetical protein